MPVAVLMIDDDEHLTSMVAQYMAQMDFAVHCEASVSGGLRSLRERHFEVLILDVMLPDGDGFEVCRTVRAESTIPILMLTARGDEMDRIVGLELGADDYLPKPFNPRELLARVRAIVRRAQRAEPARSVLRFGGLEIDAEQRLVSLDGQPCNLTGYQFDLLFALASK